MRRTFWAGLQLFSLAACDVGPESDPEDANTVPGADAALTQTDASSAVTAGDTGSADSSLGGGPDAGQLTDSASPADGSSESGASRSGQDASPEREASLPEAGESRLDGGQDGGDGDASPPNAPDAGPAEDRCDVAVYDRAKPLVALTLSGNLGTHDPALIEQDGTFYLWQTGPRVPGKTSLDLMNWQGTPSALGGQNPAWIAREVPGATDLWAPDISFFGGKYHLYYSASTFGSNASCIGHATRASLKTGAFADQGSVVCSNHGSKDDWNAIDPNVVVDGSGTPWLVFGSFWSGIKAVELNQDGARKAGAAVHALASRQGGAIEAPFVVRRCGYYYLFVSFDRCCAGVDSTYNIRVGRSPNVLGPYVDREGKTMLNGGGTLLVKGAGRWHGPGHNAVIFQGKRAYNVYHAYDGDNGGRSTLRVSELAWDEQGWPVSGGP